jgi:hypothetical protein
VATQLSPDCLSVFQAAMKNVRRTPAHLIKFAPRYINLDKSQFANLLAAEPDYDSMDSLERMILVPGDSFPKTVPLQPSTSLTFEDIMRGIRIVCGDVVAEMDVLEQVRIIFLDGLPTVDRS